MPTGFFHALAAHLQLSIVALTPAEVIFLALLLLPTAILPPLALVHRLQAIQTQ